MNTPHIDKSDEDEEIKSNAIVKYQRSDLPATFERLQCNTNLNLPPSNWMNHIEDSYGLKHVLSTSGGFSSFRMGNMFPDCVGEVDVVTGAENIKRLLKLPYSPKSVISMIIHRIGNTLLIDEFDIHKYLLRQEDANWKWLRKFLYDNILNSLNEKERNIFLTNSPTAESGAQKTSNLLSKFLCLSIKDTDSEQLPDFDDKFCTAALPLASCASDPVLPEPKEEENVPDPKSDHVYNRNVLWTFEDIRMLIGTDMAIFGDKNRPCISLRLRDMEKPINVLTGIDYWLDNLMCNVPEVVMCFHVDGIVQKYELVKTEDLPHLENSKFSPKVIRNVAQNILSFLKSNATKAGHTYWLFKGRNDEVVKLYDLTTLCGNEGNGASNHDSDSKTGVDDSGESNPFTVPVAMLLYTVAKNMKNNLKKIGPQQAGAIKTLLENCIKLLPKEKYPQIVSSSHYILSDLYIPAGIDPSDPKFDVKSDELDKSSIFDDAQQNSRSSTPVTSDDEMEGEADKSLVLATKSIQDTTKENNLEAGWKSNISPPPLTGGVLERCKKGLHHINAGLQCLEFFEEEQQQQQQQQQQKTPPQKTSPIGMGKEQILHEELHPNMAKSFQPIPLPYKQEESASQEWSTPRSSKPRPTTSSRHTEPEESDDVKKLLIKSTSGVVKSWNVHLKVLLFEKAVLIYATMAENSIADDHFGHALRQIYAAVRSQQVVSQHVHGVAGSQSSCLLGRAGDIYCQFAKKPEAMKRYLDEFRAVDKIDELIDSELSKDIQKQVETELPEPVDDCEKSFIASCAFYEVAINTADVDSKTELIRRLASIWNELGLKYMFWAQDEYQKCFEVTTELADLEKKWSDEKVEKATIESERLKFTDRIEALESSYRTLAMKSYDALKTGTDLFEKVDDFVNLSFLLCNTGRFMRFRAHIEMAGERKNDVRRQRAFYQNAFTSYQRALAVLVSRKRNPELWDMVTWELSTSTFTLAKQLQDCSDKTLPLEDVEQEVMEMLQKSLKLCDLETPGPRQVLYIFRASLIHHRIASLFHNAYRTSVDDSKRKNILQLCRLHYEKAAKYMENLKESKEFLEIQIERIALQEFLAEASPALGGRLKQLQQALELFRETTTIIDHLAGLATFENMDVDELEKLLELFEQRLQVILKTLIKVCLTKKDDKLSAMYKQMYSVTLRQARKLDVQKLAGHLREILVKLKGMEPKN